MYMRFDYIL